MVGLITADLRFNALDGTRSVLETLAAPVYWVADLPARIGLWGSEQAVSRGAVLEHALLAAVLRVYAYRLRDTAGA